MTNLFNTLSLIILIYQVNCDIPVVGGLAGEVLGGNAPDTAGTASNGGGLSIALIDNKQSLGSVGGSDNDLSGKDPGSATPGTIMASSYAMQPMMQPIMIQPQGGSTLQASGTMNGGDGYQYPVMCDAYSQCYQVYNYGYGQYPTGNYNPTPYYSGSAYNPTGYPQYYTTM